MEVTKSDNLRWELQWLRNNNLQTKLFILTRPRVPMDLPLFERFVIHRWLPRLQGIPRSNWEEFSADLQQLGYSFDFDAPGVGTVISFDSQGQAVALATEVETDTKYITEMRRWLALDDDVSQCARIRCKSCGKVALQRQSSRFKVNEICTECQIDFEHASRSPRERWHSFWTPERYAIWFWFVTMPSLFAIPMGIRLVMPHRYEEWTTTISVILLLRL